MVARFTKTWTYLVTTLVLYSVVAAGLLFLFTKHSLLLREQRPQRLKRRRSGQRRRSSSGSGQSLRLRFGNSEIHSMITTYGTPAFILICMIPVGCGVVSRVLSLLAVKQECVALARIATASWWLSKSVLYSLLISRLHLTFRDTMYRYSIDFIMLLYTLNICMNLGGGFTVPLLYVGRLRDVIGGPQNRSMTLCINFFLHDGIGAYLAITIDVTWTTVLIYLFVRPLLTLIQNQRQTGTLRGHHSGHHLSNVSNVSNVSNASNSRNSRNDMVGDDPLSVIPIKYTFLTVIAVMSTTLMIGLSALLSSAAFSVIDYAVNSLCLVLMTSQWDDCYYTFCDPIAQSLAECECCSCCCGSENEQLTDVLPDREAFDGRSSEIQAISFGSPPESPSENTIVVSKV